MNQNIAIEFKNVSKRYKMGRKLLLKEAFLDVFRPNPTVWFWVLKDVTFSVRKGESLGIIGPNGSGKSTLLKLISKFVFPDKGKIMVNGRVSPLIELGAGFHPELTGKENIFLNGVILGLTKKEIEERYEQIVDFAEVNDFIDTPVKHYSSGMYMRLGFSIAIHVNPDILLVDELLAVGDINFQKKCIRKMEEFKSRGTTIILISHDLDAIKAFCDRVIYLEKGRILSIGEPEKVISDFAQKKEFRFGDHMAEIEKVESSFNSKGKIIIVMTVKFNESLVDPVFGIVIKDKDSQEIFATNTLWNKIKTGEFKKGAIKKIIFDLKIKIRKGEYWISPAIAHANLSENYDWRSNVNSINVTKNIASKDKEIQISIK